MNNKDRIDKKKKEIIPFRFKVSGEIIKRFGEESISNKNVAILELIKNSYDAEAKKVEILFKHEEIPEHATIIIEDDGAGMNSEDIENKWMNIASPHKKEIVIKKSQRIPVGEKGLGRLSSESLGRKVFLTTKPRGESKGYCISFNWERYRKRGVYVNEIINEGYSFEKKKKEHGTRLEITGLRHDWSKEETQKELLTDIYLLNPPNKPPKDFKVISSFHQYIKDFKKIRRGFLNKATYSLKARLIRGNLVKYEFNTIKGKKRNGIYYLDKKLGCGDITFELFFYYRSQKALKDATGVEMSNAEIKEIIETLNYYQGLKLYRDNFRVKPYGELGNDWIELEIDAQNNSMCPRNHDIFGMIHISKSKNPKITDTTTREGIIHSEEFQDLMSFVKTSITGLFIDLRSEEESHKKKARKSPKIKKQEEKKKKTISVAEILKPLEKESEKEKIIDVKGDYPQSFYIKLEGEINECYRFGLPNATFCLCRKIIENLIFNILEKKFLNKPEVWWVKNEEEKFIQPKNLSPLIKSLKDNIKDFKPNNQRYIKKVLPFLEKIRNEVNPLLHNVYDYFDDKKELDKFKVNDIIQLLLNIWNNLG